MNLELTDKELINFLLTSEFEDNFSPTEHKFLLHKFRYFYRLLYAKQEGSKFEIESLRNELDNTKALSDISNTEKAKTIALLEEEVKSLLDRKLSLKERFSGRIIPTKKEDTKDEHQ